MSNYAENICVAIDQIVTTKLAGLSYDITKSCTIIDDSDKNNGKYIVSDGSMKFDAYSSDKNLRKGNNVLVTIPNGNFNMQKIIVGKQTTVNTQPFIYTAPLDTMIPVENRTYQGNRVSLLANDPEVLIKPMLTIEGEENFIGFTRLGISADFQAWLAGYDTISGSYGLKMLVYTYETNTIENEPKEAIYEMTLGSEDMYGNPYNFETFFTQEKVFDISYINNIKRIEVYFYQNADFKNGQKNNIPYQTKALIEGQDKENLSDNLFVDNFKLYVGYDQNAFTEDSLILFTSNPMTYDNKLDNNNLENKESNKKNIILRWIHKQENGSYRIIEQEEFSSDSEFSIKWYKKKIGAQAPDGYAGVNWEIVHENSLYYTFNPDITKSSEEIKAIGFIKQTESFQVYRSNLMIFTNESEVPNSSTVEVLSDLTIHFEDDSDGNYFIYNQNGKLIDSSQGSGKKRYMKVLYKGTELKEGMGFQEIIWYIPNHNSMIKLDQSYYNDAYQEDIIEYKYISYRKITRKRLEDRQAYYINDQWSPTYANNIVECQIKINNIIYSTFANLNFGKSGTNGADVTFVLTFDNGKNSLSIEDSGLAEEASLMTLIATGIQSPAEEDVVVYSRDLMPVKVRNDYGSENQLYVSAHLYDAAGKEIPLDKEDMVINWSWKHANESEEISINLPKSEDLKKFTRILSLKNDKFKNQTNISNNYNILQATLMGWGGYVVNEEGKSIPAYPLVTYLPIPIKTKNNFNYISGAKEIIYNHQGTPSYYKGVYNLYENDKIKIDCEWDVFGPYQDFLPTLKKIENGKGLTANPFYLKDQSDKVCVYCKDSNGVILWSQPILIIQNQYDFSMINDWDGSLTIDEENGTILSTMLGAGRKNSDNTFSGVLIGDIQKGTDLDEANRSTGVYGLHEGIISYSLKEDGTASFGKAGRGQIHIDGNNATIYSGNHLENDSGMLIDLDDGIIDIKGPNKEKILIQPKDPYFAIDSTEGNKLINIGLNNYYLQSDGASSTTGMKIDLKDGSIATSVMGSGAVLIQPGEPFLQVKDSSNNNLIYMGKNNYYLQSSSYSGTIQKYGFWENQKFLVYLYNEKEYALIGETFYTYSGGSYDQTTGEIKNASLEEFNFPPMTYKEITYDANGQQHTTIKQYSEKEVKNIYLSNIKPSLTKIDPEGLYLDLNNGIINGYNLYLKGTSTEDKANKFFILDSGASITPFKVGNNFNVNWDGALTCYKINEITNNGKASGNAIQIANNFYVTQNGSAGGTHPGMSVGHASNAGTANRALNADYAKFANYVSYGGGWVDGNEIRRWIDDDVKVKLESLLKRIQKIEDNFGPEALERSYKQGYSAGWNTGYNAGWNSGYNAAWLDYVDRV